MTKTMLAMLLAGALTACAALTETSERAARNAGRAIAEYCKLPQESRLQFRGMVNEAAAPHAAAINCAGDK